VNSPLFIEVPGDGPTCFCPGTSSRSYGPRLNHFKCALMSGCSWGAFVGWSPSTCLPNVPYAVQVESPPNPHPFLQPFFPLGLRATLREGLLKVDLGCGNRSHRGMTFPPPFFFGLILCERGIRPALRHYFGSPRKDSSPIYLCFTIACVEVSGEGPKVWGWEGFPGSHPLAFPSPLCVPSLFSIFFHGRVLWLQNNRRDSFDNSPERVANKGPFPGSVLYCFPKTHVSTLGPKRLSLDKSPGFDIPPLPCSTPLFPLPMLRYKH